jgi:transcriptional regulator of acetoin/glycerol metabolism
MGEPPPGMSLDRIDNDGPYNADNCKWATNLEQAQNKRNTVRLAFQGQTATLTEWAEKLGVSRNLLYLRMKRGRPVFAGLAVGNVDA